MPDKLLTTLVSVIATLNALHAVDHILRGDVHWPLDGPSVAFVLITVVTYGVLGLGLVLYRTQRVGPRFWVLVGLMGLAFGWLTHFSGGCFGRGRRGTGLRIQGGQPAQRRWPEHVATNTS